MNTILVTDEKGKVTKYRNQNEAAIALGVHKETIKNWINGVPPKGKGFRDWKVTVVEDEGNSMTGKDGYQLGKDGQALPNEYNIRKWLVLHCDSFEYNELTDNLEVNGKPIDDLMMDVICVNMEHEIGVNNDKKTRQVITTLCLKNTYNPLKKKIEKVKWDGVERAERFFIDFLGAHDIPLNHKYSKCWFKAAIKRLYEPGCMWDQMLILFDRAGGTGKTKIFERLSLGYNALNVDVTNKDAINVMNTAWIVNFDELARFDKKDMNSLKTFITTSSDINRLAYARYAKDFKRHCVFCGTTNDQYFLRDYTSDRERRFWIMNCNGKRRNGEEWKKILPDSYILQLWAEVKHWYDEDTNIEGLTVEEQDMELLVQMAHKSFGNKPEDRLIIETVLDGKYSQLALENYLVFKKEALSVEMDSSRINSIEKVKLSWLAGCIKQTEDYVAAIVLSVGGWIIRDGVAIKTNQYELSL